MILFAHSCPIHENGPAHAVPRVIDACSLSLGSYAHSPAPAVPRVIDDAACSLGLGSYAHSPAPAVPRVIDDTDCFAVICSAQTRSHRCVHSLCFDG